MNTEITIMAVISICTILVTLGGAYALTKYIASEANRKIDKHLEAYNMYVMAANDKFAHNATLAATEARFSAAVTEIKSDMKEGFREIKDMIRESREQARSPAPKAGTSR